ncbi:MULTISPECIES: plasmid pRiA4b ORF-3 family protein [unclassified Nostoc]|nr:MULTISPECIES: plasmid pRiA4b ORF-3 family protein [unclassified Nostoc]
METPPFADQVQIGDVSLEPGGKMTYLYDFGDNWKFDVQLEAINPPDNKIKKPKILEVHGNAPQQYWSEDDESDEDEG